MEWHDPRATVFDMLIINEIVKRIQVSLIAIQNETKTRRISRVSNQMLICVVFLRNIQRWKDSYLVCKPVIMRSKNK
jgi:hypothetical protein